MMQIEFIGCTSAGKSTLVNHILQICRDQGLDAWLDYDFVLGQVRLEWVKSKLARAVLVNLVSLLVGLATWRNNRKFCRFALEAISQLPVTWFERLYLGRDVLKNLGIYEIVRRRGSDRQVILVDEGTLQTAHYLFVHAAAEPSAADLSTFIRLVPLPDVVVYVAQAEPVLIERTLKRGHRRIPDRSYTQVKRFIKRAMEIFEKLREQALLQSRLIVMDSQQQVIVGRDYSAVPPFSVTAEIVRAGATRVATECLTEMNLVLDSQLTMEQ